MQHRGVQVPQRPQQRPRLRRQVAAADRLWIYEVVVVGLWLGRGWSWRDGCEVVEEWLLSEGGIPECRGERVRGAGDTLPRRSPFCYNVRHEGK